MENILLSYSQAVPVDGIFVLRSVTETGFPLKYTTEWNVHHKIPTALIETKTARCTGCDSEEKSEVYNSSNL